MPPATPDPPLHPPLLPVPVVTVVPVRMLKTTSILVLWFAARLPSSQRCAPASQWCDGKHTAAEIKAAQANAPKGFFSSLFSGR